MGCREVHYLGPVRVRFGLVALAGSSPAPCLVYSPALVGIGGGIQVGPRQNL